MFNFVVKHFNYLLIVCVMTVISAGELVFRVISGFENPFSSPHFVPVLFIALAKGTEKAEKVTFNSKISLTEKASDV